MKGKRSWEWRLGCWECLRHADEDKSAGITHTVATGVGFIGRNSC